MEILKFDDSGSSRPSSRGRKFNGKFLLLAVLAFAGLGTTLAGQITTNSNQAIEFGQAVARTASCDSNGGLTISPSAKFASLAANVASSAGNDTGTGTFTLGTISITGIDDNCVGRVFTIKGYGDANSTPITLVSENGTAHTDLHFTVGSTTGGTFTTGTNVSYTDGGTNLKKMDIGIASSSTGASATAVMKLTLESSAS